MGRVAMFLTANAFEYVRPFCASWVQERTFFGGRIHRDLDVRAIGLPWVFFQVFP